MFKYVLFFFSIPMIQFFVFGSSTASGVGGAQGGWADLVKRELYRRMYAPDGVGEKYEFYNFSKAGATIDFVAANAPLQLEQYGRKKCKAVYITCSGRK